MFLIVYYLIISALAATCTQNANIDNCATEKCEMIGKIEVCTECKTGGNVPIDGTCTKVGDAKEKCKKDENTPVGDTDTKCGKCEGATFMFKGGCYQTTQQPGQTICQAAGTTAGKCQTCKADNGYFTNPEAAPTVDSCISCGDTTGVTIGESNNAKTYKGVAGCAKCDPPGQITGGSGGTKEATCTACEDGFFVKGSSTKTCEACGDDNCATCAEAGNNKCSKCKADGKLYLKKNTGSDKGTCVSAVECTAAGSYFPDSTSNPKECKACDSTCKTCSGGAANDKCTSCNANKPYLKKNSPTDPTGTCTTEQECTKGNTYYADDTVDPTSGKRCRKCAEGGLKDCSTCEISNTQLVCKACTDGDKNKFGLGKKSCVKDCPANSQAGSDSVCVCNAGFTPNADSSACGAASSDPNLSAGAIAGISVAAVVVVGGLVGFLCWWFICRGKA